MMKPTLVLWGILCLFSPPAEAWGKDARDGLPAAGDESVEQLAAAVKDLELGEGAFVIGARLTAEQVAAAGGNLIADTYPGTIKFPAGDAVVVADEKTHLILALYQRREDVGANEVQEMVGGLMARFGEPTTVAHDKLIYWAYDQGGKIAGDAFLEAKATGAIDILATVKFNSTLDLDQGPDNDNMEETGTIYYIITSNRLLNSYIADP
ncbi:MAG: hypothetical protein ABFS42_06530 [Candidatus Krumholzibacteriota bacterium]